MDRKTREIMTPYDALHPKSDVDRVYVARQKEGRGLISSEMCVKGEENNPSSGSRIVVFVEVR